MPKPKPSPNPKPSPSPSPNPNPNQGLLEPLGGGGTALVTTLQAKLSAHNENRMGRVGALEARDVGEM